MTDKLNNTRRRFGGPNNKQTVIRDPSYNDEQPIINEGLIDKQQALQAMNDQLRYIDERYDAINKIASDVIQINELMVDLNTLVNEQGQMIDTIEANVTQAQQYINKGTEEIQKANVNQKKSRGKMLTLGALLATIGVGIGIGVKVI